MSDPDAIVSPGGVGFDINCGVRLVRCVLTDRRTNLTEEQVKPVQEELVQALYDHIPVGVGTTGILGCTRAGLEAALEMGIDW